MNEGTYLTSAGSTYTTGQSYGKNFVTLTTNNLPSHTHTGPSHTHTMAHTHTNPSHTHGVGTLAAASAGNHTHDWKGYIGFSTNGAGSYQAAVFGHDSAWSYVNGGKGPQKTGAHTHTISGATAAAGNGQTGASSAANTGASGTGNTGSTGKGAAFNNMPKSIAIPLWTRTK